MGFSTGSSASKRAKRKAKQLEFLQKMRERTTVLHQMRQAQGGVDSSQIASGSGFESSGGQGVASSLIAQGASNYTLARESGKLQKSMERDIAKAKRGANKVKIAIALTAAATGGALGAVGAGTAAGAVTGASAGLNIGNFVGATLTSSVDNRAGGAAMTGATAQSALSGLETLVGVGKQPSTGTVPQVPTEQTGTVGGGIRVDGEIDMNLGPAGGYRSDTQLG